jgi:hypothetical protein
MADPGNGGTDNALSEAERLPPMAFGEKFLFLAFPAWVAIVGMPFFLSAYFSIRIPILLLLHPHYKYIKQAEPMLVYLFVSTLVFGAILIYPVSVIRRMIRRKRATGSSFPSGEELAAFRLRWNNPSRWKRAYPPGIFALFACGWTYTVIRAPHRLPLFMWSFPALAWIIVTMVAIDCFFPRRERQWTGICTSVAFGSLAVVYLIGAPHVLRRQAEYWIFPLLTGSTAVCLAISVIRDWKRRSGTASAASTEP